MKKTYARPLYSILIIMLTASFAAAIVVGDILITTDSDAARDYYLQGRDLAEKLRAQEAFAYFQKAVEADPDFAMAYLNMALTQNTNKGFFKYFDRAKTLAAQVSEGERLMILGVEAGTNADPMTQREHYTRLTELYPNDPRAHNLLGNHYFAQQEYDLAIEQYLKAIRQDPEFSQPYNQLGYCYRFMEDYSEARRAFKRYTQLIPDDPNPYDSYAELLLKMGKFNASIMSYRKALEVNPNFTASYLGIATNLNLKGLHDEAREQLQELYNIARDDGQRRAALQAMAISFMDEGKPEKALQKLTQQYELARRIEDSAAMAIDLVNMGHILYETERIDEAKAKYEEALQVMENSGLSEEVIENGRRTYLYNMTRVELRQEDMAAAENHAIEFESKARELNNANQLRLAFELHGMVALANAEYNAALKHFQQTNLQDPYNIYRLALAYDGLGNTQKAKEMYEKTVNFNALNNLNYAFVRHYAKLALDMP